MTSELSQIVISLDQNGNNLCHSRPSLDADHVFHVAQSLLTECLYNLNTVRIFIASKFPTHLQAPTEAHRRQWLGTDFLAFFGDPWGGSLGHICKLLLYGTWPPSRDEARGMRAARLGGKGPVPYTGRG